MCRWRKVRSPWPLPGAIGCWNQWESPSLTHHTPCSIPRPTWWRLRTTGSCSFATPVVQLWWNKPMLPEGNARFNGWTITAEEESLGCLLYYAWCCSWWLRPHTFCCWPPCSPSKFRCWRLWCFWLAPCWQLRPIGGSAQVNVHWTETCAVSLRSRSLRLRHVPKAHSGRLACNTSKSSTTSLVITLVPGTCIWAMAWETSRFYFNHPLIAMFWTFDNDIFANDELQTTGPRYYLCSNLVKPLTQKVELSYAEMVGPSRVQWFVSHFWGMPFAHFVRCLKGHAQNGPMTSYWVCTFSNNQWRVSDELGHGNVEDSSFYLALRGGCQGTLFVLDEEVLPLTRSWCLFELFQTELLNREVHPSSTQLGSPGSGDQPAAFQLLLGTSSGVMNYGESSMDLALKISKKLSTLRLQDAEASCLEDKLMINEAVSKHPGGFQAVPWWMTFGFWSLTSKVGHHDSTEVNAFLFEAVKLALQQTEHRFRTDVAQLQEDLARLSCPRAPNERVLLGRLSHQPQIEGKEL